VEALPKNPVCTHKFHRSVSILPQSKHDGAKAAADAGDENCGDAPDVHEQQFAVHNYLLLQTGILLTVTLKFLQSFSL
jgi:hypothetical protein